MKNKRNKNQNSKIQNLNPISRFQTPNSHFPTLTTQHSGITLIALVVTVVVLLILAGVSLTLMIGDNNIFKLAKEAGDKTNEAIKSEQSQIDELNKWLTENGYGSENGGSGGGENPKLEVGSSVTYNLAGDEYTWNKEYATSDETGTETLSSKTGGEFRLTDWKVLAINETKKEVTLVPTAPTAGTVRLQGAQGYNNAVKLLNDSCSKLYGNSAKGITARSIKIEDIEKYMKDDALNGTEEIDGAYEFVSVSGTKYGEKVNSVYTGNKDYPVIYGKEQRAVINGITPTDATLELSDSPTNFIERTESEATNGKMTAKTSIQPYQTLWIKYSTFMSTVFREEDNTKVNYYDLIMPQEDSTYWVASRCVNTHSTFGGFYVRKVWNNSVNAELMYRSENTLWDASYALFPVVTLSSELIKVDTNGNFVVQL